MQQTADAPATDWADQTEQQMLDAALVHAPELGWNALMARRAAKDVGLSQGETELLLPHGARDLAALLSRRHDARALATLAATDPRSLKMRQRIVSGLEVRIEAAADDFEAARRCAGFLALPNNAALALRLAWDTADLLWRWAGDTATDENHYSKRAILSGILVTALPLRLNADRETAQRYVQDRVGNVMAFEQWKAGLPAPKDLGARLASTLGKLRYGR